MGSCVIFYKSDIEHFLKITLVLSVWFYRYQSDFIGTHYTKSAPPNELLFLREILLTQLLESLVAKGNAHELTQHHLHNGQFWKPSKGTD